MTRRAQRPKQVAHQPVAGPVERLEQAAVGSGVGAEAACRLFDRALQHHRRAVLERVGERRLRLHQLEAVLGQRQAAQERGRERKRMDGRAGVVREARQRELLRAEPPPTASAPSRTVTRRRARASAIAAASPLGPEPTTTRVSQPPDRA